MPIDMLHRTGMRTALIRLLRLVRGPRLFVTMMLTLVLTEIASAAELPDPRPLAPVPDPGSHSPTSLALPDLITLPPSDLRLEGDWRGFHRILRFTNTVANTGQGVMELSGVYQPESGRYQVSQRLHNHHGDVVDEIMLPEIVFHPGHDHWHLADFARYELWSLRPDGSVIDIVSIRTKISYCMIDTDPWTVPGDARPVYTGCIPERQGLSVGWADSYRFHLDGQWLDVAGLADGLYALRSIADPYNLLRESVEGNNEATLVLRLNGNQVAVVPGVEVSWGNLRHVGPQE